MIELGTISQERALELIHAQKGTILADTDGGLHDSSDVIELIMAARKFTETSGRGHELWIQASSGTLKIDLAAGE